MIRAAITIAAAALTVFGASATPTAFPWRSALQSRRQR